MSFQVKTSYTYKGTIIVHACLNQDADGVCEPAETLGFLVIT